MGQFIITARIIVHGPLEWVTGHKKRESKEWTLMQGFTLKKWCVTSHIGHTMIFLQWWGGF